MNNSNIEPLINAVLSNSASDLHLNCGDKPAIRVDGSLIKLDYKVLNSKDIKELCFPLLNENQINDLQANGAIDGMFSFENSRFRFNIYKSMGQLSASLRFIPKSVPTLDDINAPIIFKQLSKVNSGLILVTGPTGNGKSTTLASIINEINRTQNRHIITIEDPVEFLHTPIKSLISQREIKNDTKDFTTGIKCALRQDPDVILIGEMRDKETIAAALTAAETGHLVLATLHTSSAPKSINRVIDSFDSASQNQIRAMLASSLRATISQTLVPKIGGGRATVWEIMINNNAISNLIREGKIHQIYSTMQLGQNESGMQTQTKNLQNLVNKGIIEAEVAINMAYYPDELKRNTNIF